ncbi:ABC-2 transporter permease [Clostridiales bacterium COT073_COT-073]|nr:ABC-2 transporter permease [Clostridiales bacterium COT073_COT-073]
MLNFLIKDYLLLRRNIWMIVVLTLVLPLIVRLIDFTLPGTISFFYMIIMSPLLTEYSLSMEEEKNADALAYICSLPNGRRNYVYAKYMGAFLVILYCLLVYCGMYFIFYSGKSFYSSTVVKILFCGISLMAVYIPVDIKHGINGVKYIFIPTVLLVSSGPLFFSRLLTDNGWKEAMHYVITKNENILILIFVGVCVYGISAMISIRIMRRKEV